MPERGIPSESRAPDGADTGIIGIVVAALLMVGGLLALAARRLGGRDDDTSRTRPEPQSDPTMPPDGGEPARKAE